VSKDGDANGVFRSGALTEMQPTDGADKFTYDPLDTHRGEFVEGIDPKDKTAAIDQTFALSIANDGLVYHTDPLPNETPLVGCPAVTLWLSIDTPDVDLECDLYEVQPDGTTIALWSSLGRLRYRESLREARLVKSGEILKCDFNPGLFIARQLMKGSRLRLVVTAVNFDFLAKNYCLGESLLRRRRRTRAPVTCRSITTLRTRAQSNSLFADAFDPSNIGCRRSIFVPGDDRAGRFGNRSRHSLSASGGNQSLPSVSVSRGWKTVAPVDE